MNEKFYCAIYARYSSHHQREASITDQIRKCQNFATTKGWIPLDEHIYYDQAKSGSGTYNRDAFKAMMRVAMGDHCPFQRILVDDTSRIARNTREALEIFSLLSFYGIHVFYVSQNIDTAHETAEEMITINGLIDSLFIRNLAKETHRGMEGQVLKGFSAGGRRFGYYSEPIYASKVDIYGRPIADGYKLKIDYEEADTVIRIFSLFGEQGYSVRRIVKVLNQEVLSVGKPKPPRGVYWGISTLLGNKKTLTGILNNEIYLGKYYWNRSHFKRNPLTAKMHRFKKVPEEWIVFNNPELRIISDALWNKVKSRQRQIVNFTSGRYTKGKALYSTNLLTGLAICGHCKGNIAIASYKKYGCSNNKNHGDSVCSNRIKIVKTSLEAEVLRHVKIDIRSEAFLSSLQERVSKLVGEYFSRQKSKWQKSAAMESLKKVGKEITNYLNAIKAGFISDALKASLKKAEDQKQNLELLLNRSTDEQFYLLSVSKDLIVDYLRDFHRTLNLHPALGKAFLSKLFDKVLVCSVDDIWQLQINYKKVSADGHDQNRIQDTTPTLENREKKNVIKIYEG